MIWADVYRRLGHADLRGLLALLVLERTFRPIASLRLCQTLPAWRVAAPLRLAALLLHRSLCNAAAMDLPARTSIGPGLDISHGWSIVVSGRAVLGSNVTLFHGATIGQGDKIGADGSRQVGYPVLEDEVWVGPNATLLGGITIGAGSRIMPGAVVTSDVPPRSMVAGNPARVIRSDCPIDCRNRALLPV